MILGTKKVGMESVEREHKYRLMIARLERNIQQMRVLKKEETLTSIND